MVQRWRIEEQTHITIRYATLAAMALVAATLVTLRPIAAYAAAAAAMLLPLLITAGYADAAPC